MKNKIATILLAMAAISACTALMKHTGDNRSVISNADRSLIGVKTAVSDGKPQTPDDSEIIQAQSRTNESFESELRSYSNKELRKELEVITAVLDPILEISNRQALSLSQRVIVVNGLRRRQAALKILIDRRIDLAERRLR